jgi:hypothetical protein
VQSGSSSDSSIERLYNTTDEKAGIAVKTPPNAMREELDSSSDDSIASLHLLLLFDKSRLSRTFLLVLVLCKMENRFQLDSPAVHKDVFDSAVKAFCKKYTITELHFRLRDGVLVAKRFHRTIKYVLVDGWTVKQRAVLLEKHTMQSSIRRAWRPTHSDKVLVRMLISDKRICADKVVPRATNRSCQSFCWKSTAVSCQADVSMVVELENKKRKVRKFLETSRNMNV